MARYFKDAFSVQAGALAHTFTATTELQVRELRVHVSAAPTTSENFTVTLDSVDGAEHNLLLYSIDLSAASTTDVRNTDLDVLLLPGDALVFAYANTDANTIGVQLLLE